MGEHCSNDKCCGRQSQSCNCCGHCGCKSHSENHDDIAQYLLKVADCAWMEVLKEKIKEQIISHEADRMKELAKILQEGNSERWKHKKEGKRNCKEFEEKLCNFFSKGKK